MDNNHETEEEMKERLKKEILEEMKQETKETNDSNEVRSYGAPKETSKVHFNGNEVSPTPLQEINHTPKEVTNNEETSSNTPKKGGTSMVLIIVCGIIVLIAILLFPTISKKISEFRNSQKKPTATIEEPEEKEYEKITIDSAIVQKLKYPVMHNDRTNKNTYYSKDKLTIGNFSNNDILYNALLDMPDVFILKYNGKYSGKFCGSTANKASIEGRYFKLRIENLYTRNAKYSLTNFSVPTNSTNTKYVGTWKYDAKSDTFVYYGNCGKVTTSNIEYYDIKVPYEASSSEKNVEIYVDNHVAFAIVNRSTKAYILYKNADYTEEITRGTLTTTNYQQELTNVVKALGKDKTKDYRYTFTIEDCAYQDYCFLSGEYKK